LNGLLASDRSFQRLLDFETSEFGGQKLRHKEKNCDVSVSAFAQPVLLRSLECAHAQPIERQRRVSVQL
jgi:hypothetical protein